jgi:hypothetical protein
VASTRQLADLTRLCHRLGQSLAWLDGLLAARGLASIHRQPRAVVAVVVAYLEAQVMYRATLKGLR